jgi:hypothetical protein
MRARYSEIEHRKADRQNSPDGKPSDYSSAPGAKGRNYEASTDEKCLMQI